MEMRIGRGQREWLSNWWVIHSTIHTFSTSQFEILTYRDNHEKYEKIINIILIINK